MCEAIGCLALMFVLMVWEGVLSLLGGGGGLSGGDEEQATWSFIHREPYTVQKKGMPRGFALAKPTQATLKL